MENALTAFFEKVKDTVRTSRFSIRITEEGKVLAVGDGIVHVAGLRDAKLYELIKFESGDEGIVFDLDVDSIGVVLLTDRNGIRAGDKGYKTEQIASVNVSEELLGRVLDALGNPIDDGPKLEQTTPCPVEREAPSLSQRDFITEPLYTGIKVIDSMLAIGKGQRELIIGDPSTGKTSIAVDTVINQKNSHVISVYVVIGQKKSHVLKIIEEVKKYGDFSRTIFVIADASNSPGLQYIAPYSATAIAEYFLDKGKNVLIIYDDLTKHADAYRSLSLLLKKPPGREAYPGDIFFIHSRLLERSAKLNQKSGGGSITALPIVETQQGRISSYIPTNLISITDGQIYLDTLLFNKGIRPAVDVSKSVSRIGGKAQVEAMRTVAERLKIDYSRFIEVEVFTKFGAHLEEETSSLIRRGERLREILKQPQFHPVTLEDEVLSFIILESGILDTVAIASTQKVCKEIINKTKSTFPEIVGRVNLEGLLGKKDLETVKDFIVKERV
ncbi:MAG: F0F1 ATP synthase subunit alpha [Candidatus Brocadia sp.]|uniref:ATP synthase subunit alpha n=1 Tax=Candidatus Brocadia fulgida TaxID=380242 RepID=A0A0M2UX90_9BACT|nr:MAG: ATPAencoding subunit alpha of ATP synthase [Candidatus Brocadia fulgida]MCC6326485.1 F0F1 ATP synthase subunit alpha [Candidatus Brocadia sp.]MCE7911590.1 F0F1 ATP synthase subunit alpha [Candidatus Brocadia sp. AMX3]MBV6518604.1 ATP synthase subunit alpha, sodium ion specific [Candidatus Brocadia fulgida]MDG5997443.1 F0F1 ATP synthase subunit alpha [Candidatus Brocadia sp.]